MPRALRRDAVSIHRPPLLGPGGRRRFKQREGRIPSLRLIELLCANDTALGPAAHKLLRAIEGHSGYYGLKLGTG
eukprot:15482645-Alexandrium_andersonii.AAC.1